MAICFVLGDITSATTDAIVNAANPAMLGGGGVDGAIHRAAGPELIKACQAVAVKDGVRCPPGEARITPAGKLAAKFVIHTVGPIYHQDPHPAQTLARAYQQSCRLLQHQRLQNQDQLQGKLDQRSIHLNLFQMFLEFHNQHLRLLNQNCKYR